MCCFVPEIEELDKPVDTWCRHCTGHSCRIHGEHPKTCRDFQCAWIANPLVAEHWYPKRAKMLLYTSKDDDGFWIRIRMHPEHPNRWREEPYYSDIKRFSARGLNSNPRLYTLISWHNDSWFILPDREIHNPQPGIVVRKGESYEYLPTGSSKAANALTSFLNGCNL